MTEANIHRSSIPHVPALDGLRGLAVLGVLLFHDDRLPGGFLGVDLFFVLSGFLITSLLLAEWERHGAIDLRAFWIRRARRLFPALILVLWASCAYAWLFSERAELGRIRSDALATLGYVANWRAIFAGRSYWDMFARPSPLEHTWSLAIEEQFYVLWPLICVAVLRVGTKPKKTLLVATSVLALLSAAAMFLLYSPLNTSRAYLGTDTRGASILVGAALACMLRGRTALSAATAKGLHACAWASVLVLAVCWWRMDGQGEFLYRGGFWGTELLAAVVIACGVLCPSALLARVLAVKPLVWMGLISYGLYLWHWPVFVVLDRERLGFDGLWLSVLRFSVTLGLSLLSFFVVEQPIRRTGLPWGRPLWVVPGVVAGTLALVFWSTRGAAPAEVELAIAQAGLHELPELGDRDVDSSLLLLGDSVAQALGERLHALQPGTRFVVAERGVGNCSILEDQKTTLALDNKKPGRDCDHDWEKDVAALKPDVVMIVLGGGFFGRIQIDGKWERPCEQGWHDAFDTELERQIALISAHTARVILVIPPYPVKKWISKGLYDKVDCYNRTLLNVAKSFRHVEVLDLQTKVCPQGRCIMDGPNGYPLRPDGLHFAGWGAEALASWILKQIEQPLERPGDVRGVD